MGAHPWGRAFGPMRVRAVCISLKRARLLSAARFERRRAAAPQRKRQFERSIDRSLPRYQFCVMFSVDTTRARQLRFSALLSNREARSTAMTDAAPATMLTPGIHASFEQGVDALAGHDAVKTVARGKVGDGVNQAVGAIFDTTAEAFLADRALSHEVFGSSSVVVRCRDMAEIARVIAGLEGQLTATLQMDAADEADAARLVPVIARRVGRILANGWPTGVEVAPAMVHGGPFPATSDGRTTSVGTLAIARYLRPVCFQNLAPALLPAALDDANPWGIARRLDGKREASPR